jgi:hypothetical protein
MRAQGDREQVRAQVVRTALEVVTQCARDGAVRVQDTVVSRPGVNRE